MRLAIQVTERDIMNGSCADAKGCAIALAATRAIESHPRIASVMVLPRTIKLYDASGKLVCCRNLPPQARTFVTVYDSGHCVRPFNFGVNLPHEHRKNRRKK
jgi:hypothetical protein